MNSRLRSIGGQVGLSCFAGVSLGVGIVHGRSYDLVLVGALFVAAIAAEWLEVQIGAVGYFTLRPAMAFVGLWSGGVALLMFCGLLPIALIAITVKRSSVVDAIRAMGIECASLWAGYLAYVGLANQGGAGFGGTTVVAPWAYLGSFVAYWMTRIPIQALQRHQDEGIRYSVALATLGHRLSLHVLVLMLVAVFLNYVLAHFGVLLMLLAAVVFIEGYYPWKLLGEQSGVLLTSLQMMAQAIDLKDPYTSKHSQRVSHYAVRIARAMGLREEEVERIRIGGLMHDIGKIGIRGKIIRKPDKLTPEERTLMMGHSSVSADIIQHLEILGLSAEMVRHHHEHCDGSGYPDGLKTEEIPVGSRVILVADAFDALTTDRPYRKGASKADALAVIRSNSRTQFHTEPVKALERIIDAL